MPKKGLAGLCCRFFAHDDEKRGYPIRARELEQRRIGVSHGQARTTWEAAKRMYVGEKAKWLFILVVVVTE